MSAALLREPLATFIRELNTFQFTASGGRIQGNGGLSIYGLPVLDHDDAVELAKQMNAAVSPILKRYADRKLAEFLPTAQPYDLKKI